MFTFSVTSKYLEYMAVPEVATQLFELKLALLFLITDSTEPAWQEALMNLFQLISASTQPSGFSTGSLCIFGQV